jgi:hypothetical protein
VIDNPALSTILLPCSAKPHALVAETNEVLREY